MLTLVGNTKSRAFRVLWMLEELGLDYDFQVQMPRSEEVRALNPLGKVPVLIDGAAVLTDSTAILTYLADKHGSLTFPAGSLERARQDSHTFFLLDEFDACLWTAARHSFILPEDQRVPDVKNSLRWEFERSQKHFVDRLGKGPWLMGETFTVPDIIAAHCGSWAINAKFPVTEQSFRDYIDRARNRPAYKRASAK
jgi:glutathione S-transferase